MSELSSDLKVVSLIIDIAKKVHGLFPKKDYLLANEYATRGFHILFVSNNKKNKKYLRHAVNFFKKSLEHGDLFSLCAYGTTRAFISLKEKTSATKYAEAMSVKNPDMKHLVEELQQEISMIK